MRQGRNDGVRPSRMPTGADAEKSHGAGGFPASPTRRRRRPHLDRRQTQEALRINNNNFPPDILQCRPKIKKTSELSSLSRSSSSYSSKTFFFPRRNPTWYSRPSLYYSKCSHFSDARPCGQVQGHFYDGTFFNCLIRV